MLRRRISCGLLCVSFVGFTLVMALGAVLLPGSSVEAAMQVELPPRWVGTRVAEPAQPSPMQMENTTVSVYQHYVRKDRSDCLADYQYIAPGVVRPRCYFDTGAGTFDPVVGTFAEAYEEVVYEPEYSTRRAHYSPAPYVLEEGWMLGIVGGNAVVVVPRSSPEGEYDIVKTVDLEVDGVIEKQSSEAGTRYVIHTDSAKTVTDEASAQEVHFQPDAYVRSTLKPGMAGLTTENGFAVISPYRAKAWIVTYDVAADHLGEFGLSGSEDTVVSIYNKDGETTLKAYSRHGCRYGELPEIARSYPCPVKDLWTGTVLDEQYSVGLPEIEPELAGKRLLYAYFDIHETLVVAAEDPMTGSFERWGFSPGAGHDYNKAWPNVSLSPPPADPTPPPTPKPEPPPPPPKNLLALGDSYISGEGAYQYRQSTPTDAYAYSTDLGKNKCHTSGVSYPYLLGKKYFDTYGSVACSGAVTGDIINASPKYRGQVKDGIDQAYRKEHYTQFINQYVPGYLNQLQFVEAKKPSTVIVSVGGNDIGFTDILTLCVLTKTESCFETRTQRLELAKHLNRLHYILSDTYRAIRKASPDTQLYVVGYPEIAKVDGNCGANVHLDADEVKFAQYLVAHFNTVIARAATSAGARYVNIENAFIGHRLCEKTKTPAVNGLTAGDDIFGVLAKESYHPTAYGHTLIAKAIETETNKFTLGMPHASSAGPLSEENTKGALFVTSGAKDSALERVRYIAQVPFMPAAVSDKIVELTIETKLYGVRPGAVYSIVLHSQPVTVASGLTDENGAIATSFTIPDNVAPGVHVAHVYTQDGQGRDIDIQQLVYIRAGGTDYDGDGVPNAAAQCLAVPDSGVDADGDGRDDACDGELPYPDDVPASGEGASGVPQQSSVVPAVLVSATSVGTNRGALVNTAAGSLQPNRLAVIARETADTPTLLQSNVKSPGQTKTAPVPLTVPRTVAASSQRLSDDTLPRRTSGWQLTAVLIAACIAALYVLWRLAAWYADSEPHRHDV